MFSKSLVEQLVDKSPSARLGQLDDAGHAQALPFVFARVGNILWSPVDGKPKKHEHLSRLGWVVQRPAVCVLVDHYEADWSQLWWLKLYCHAEVHHSNHPHWSEGVNALAEKYVQYTTTPMFLGDPTMIRFEINDWKSWAAGGDEGVATWLRDRR